MLMRRGAILATIRRFFAERGVLEVETPVLGHHGVTDRHLASLSTCLQGGGAVTTQLFLQTSPEFAMKRLLATGSGPIYQIGKAFRDEERGRHHNPEFTMLEWYRPGFDHHALMDEVDALLSATLDSRPGDRGTYGALFQQHFGLDPHTAGRQRLMATARRAGIDLREDLAATLGRDDWLNLLMTHVVEPSMPRDRPTFVYDYPASQAALARLRTEGAVRVAERFEVYASGVELANGFHELADAAEQRERFEIDRAARAAAGLPTPAIDQRLLAALEHGLGDCAGVALGIDRLLMVQTGAEHIDQVLSFPIERA
jgi:lysyl-tRNA synthetase class 2